MARGLAGSSHTRGYLSPVLVSLARHALQTLFPLPGCPSCPPGRLGPARPSGPLGRRFPRIDRPTSQSTLTPQVQSSPSSAGPEDAFLSLPPPRQGRTTLPCDAPTASGARAPSPAAVVRPAPGRAPETRGAFKGPFKEWNSQFLGPPWQMTTHLVCGIAQTDSLMVVEVRSPKWILPDKPRGVPRAGSFWSFRRRSCCLGSPARGGARLPWPVALTSLTPRPSPRPLP